MFIDGTFMTQCRPDNSTPGAGIFADLQRLFYTGAKKAHGFVFQGVIAPNGLFVDFWGPTPGRNNDIYTERVSGVAARLRALFTRAGWPLVRWRIYGDSIYVISDVISRRWRGASISDLQKSENTAMNSPRTSVEWGFGGICSMWKYVDLRRNNRLLASPAGIGVIYRVAALLTNFKTCVEGSLTGRFFGLAPPSLADYVNGHVTPQLGAINRL